MGFQKIAITSLVVLVLLAASLFDKSSNQSIEVFSSAKLPGTLVLISRHGSPALDSFFPGKNNFVRVLFSGEPPEQFLIRTFSLKQNIQSLVIQAFLAAMIRIDHAFAVRLAPGLVSRILPRLGVEILFGESAASSRQGEIFPESFFSFRLFSLRAIELSALNPATSDELANYLLSAKTLAQEQRRETIFKFQRLNLSGYPTLERPIGSPMGDGSVEAAGISGFDDQNLVIYYLTPAGGKWAYCASFETGTYRCSHRGDDFSPPHQRALSLLRTSVSRQAKGNLVQLDAGRRLETAFTLMNLCSHSELSREQQTQLHDLVLKERVLYAPFNSTLPASLENCARKLDDKRLISYSRFIAARLRFEQANYLSSSEFFKAITGEPDGWSLEDSSWNWYSDATQLLSAGKKINIRAFSERIADFNSVPGVSGRATDALTLILLLKARHVDAAAAEFARNSLLNNRRYLSLAERDWVEKRLQELHPENTQKLSRNYLESLK